MNYIYSGLSVLRKCILVESAPISISSNRLDPLVYENALIILSLSSQEVRNTDFIQSRHARIVEILTERKNGLPSIWAEELGQLIDDTNIAYQTVMQRIQEEQKVSADHEESNMLSTMEEID